MQHQPAQFVITAQHWQWLFALSAVLTEQAMRAAVNRGEAPLMVEAQIPYQARVVWHHHHLQRGASPYVSAGHHLGEVQGAIAEVMTLPPVAGGA